MPIESDQIELFDSLEIGEAVSIQGESGVIVDKMTNPLTRIRVDFDGNKYPRPLWVSLRLLDKDWLSKKHAFAINQTNHLTEQ